MARNDLIPLFFIMPAIFYTLCWAHLRIVFHQNTIVSYLENVLNLKLKILISQDSNNTTSDLNVWGWENFYNRKISQKAKFWNYPILGPLFSLQIGTSIILVTVPFIMNFQGRYTFSSFDYILFVLNGITIFYTTLQGWKLFHERVLAASL